MNYQMNKKISLILISLLIVLLTNVPPLMAKDKRVIIFSTSWCGYCIKAKAFFKKHNISFQEYDIEKNKKAAQLKDKLAPHSGVPLVIIGKKVINGYSPEQYIKALKQK